MVGVTSHESWIIMQSSLNPLPIHFLRWIRSNVHLLHIGFQVDSCERNKPDLLHIRCASLCPCERAFINCNSTCVYHFMWCNCMCKYTCTTNSHTYIVNLITLSTVCAIGYVIGCFCVWLYLYTCTCHKISAVLCLASQKMSKKVPMLLSFCTYVVNVMVNCQFTRSWVLVPFLCSCLCALTRLQGLGGQTLGISCDAVILSCSCSGSASVDF